MDKITHSDIKQLASDTTEPKVSLYMPLHRQAAAQNKHDHLQLKNLLSQAEDALRLRGLGANETKQLLTKAERLLGGGNFWRYGAQSMALFLSPGQQRLIRLGQELEPKLVVNDHFHLVPLIEMVVSEQPFYLLALAQEEPRLIYASTQFAEELEVPGMPTGKEQLTQYKEVGKEQQGRSGLGPSMGGAYYSKGVNDHNVDQDLLDYLRLIDKAVIRATKKEGLPLMLVGADPLPTHYRKLSKYPQLVSQYISGNPHQIPADKLVNRAHDLMQPIFDQQKQQAVGRYLEVAAGARNRVSDRLSAIVEAAAQGRVETLLVPSAQPQPVNNFYEQLGASTSRQSQRRLRREEEIDKAILATIMNGGEVLPLNPSRIPGHGQAAAILRF